MKNQRKKPFLDFSDENRHKCRKLREMMKRGQQMMEMAKMYKKLNIPRFFQENMGRKSKKKWEMMEKGCIIKKKDEIEKHSKK
jgi:hypothetical protein